MSCAITERCEDGVVHWIFDRPDRANALDRVSLEWVTMRLAQLRGQTVILSSPHPGFFCAGFDLQELARSVQALGPLSCAEETNAELPDAPLIACTRAMARAHACLVAVVDAPAVGAAVEILAHCDALWITDRASFRVPARRLGVVYHPHGLAQIRHRFGDEASFQLVVQGATLTAPQLGPRPRIYHRPELAQLQEAMAPWLEELQDQDPQTRGLHCAQLRGPPGPWAPASLQAYEQARQRAYRSTSLRRALDVPGT